MYMIKNLRQVKAPWRNSCICRSISEYVRIGCASGFWGDTTVAAKQLVNQGRLDFLVFDYLSEITMSLLTAAKLKMPDMGYVPDFIQVALQPNLKAIKEKGIRIVSNAGGINPISCVKAIEKLLVSSGMNLNVAVIVGDDLMAQKEELLSSQRIREMNSGALLPSSVTSMTAYLGAGAIQSALDSGADIVVTGRCADSALVLGPLLHRFKWDKSDVDRLASGSLAGHLIECGAQVTGGIFTDWHAVPDWHNIGFPIVECYKDGSFSVCKPPDTGGLITSATVSEQLVYEIGDPSNYILPDVVCDFSNVQLKESVVEGEPRVLVTGARGKPQTSYYKVSATYADGYRATAVCITGGPKSKEKAMRTAQAIMKRVSSIFKGLQLPDFSDVYLQYLGAEDSYGAQATPGDGPRDGVLWMAVSHKEKKALEIFSREIAAAGTGMAPGLCSVVGGRPKISPIFKLFSFLHPKDKVKIFIGTSGNTLEEFQNPLTVQTSEKSQPNKSIDIDKRVLSKGNYCFKLQDLAYTRSGDKGNDCNVGVIARRPHIYPYLRQALKEEAIESYFKHVFVGHSTTNGSRVLRYELPGIHALNFVLKNSLGGGGIASLRSDPQGKAFGQMLLDFEITNVPNLLDNEKLP